MPAATKHNRLPFKWLGLAALHSLRSCSLPGGKLSILKVEKKRQILETKVRSYLVPSTLRYNVYPLHPDGSSTVLVVEVPPMEAGVAAVWREPHGGGSRLVQYPYRTSHGKQYMTPQDVEERLMNGSRAQELRLRRLVSDSKEFVLNSTVWTKRDVQPTDQRIHGRTIVSRGKRVGYVASATPGRIGELYESEFQLELAWPNRVINIPYGLLRHVWRTQAGTVGIMLQARIVVPKDGLAYLDAVP